MGRGGPIIKGWEYDFPKTVQQWPKLRLVKSTSKLRRLLHLFWKDITLQGKKIHLRNRTSSLRETGARMLLMAFQNKALKGSTLRRQPWQINTAVLVQCQKHPAHSRSVEHSQAAHKYLGCRTDHCVGKGKGWECSRQLPHVKSCCLHRCHRTQPWLKQGSAIPPCITSTAVKSPSLGFQSLKHWTPCLDFLPWSIIYSGSIFPLNNWFSSQCLQQHCCYSQMNRIKPVSIMHLLSSHTDSSAWLMAWCDQSSCCRLVYLPYLGKTFLGTGSSNIVQSKITSQQSYYL